MDLKCTHCGHEWQDNPPEKAPSVICPECLERIPIEYADHTTYLRMQEQQAPEMGVTQPIRSEPGGAVPDEFGETMPMSETGDSEPTRRIPSPSFESSASVHAEPTVSIPASGNMDGSAAPTAPPPTGGRTRPSGQGQPTPSSTGGARARHQELVGRALGGYRLEKLLGAGGMGAVYLAHQNSLDRKVALKVLPPHLAKNPELLARFTREALSVAHLTHHNVIQAYDVGHEDGIHYMSMEFVEGHSIGDMIRKDGPLRIDDAAGYILQACRGLHYAHERGVIHRDIKPDNLMVNTHGVVKIADLGLAKLRKEGIPTVQDPKGMDVEAAKHQVVSDYATEANIAFGTPAYMSPEQGRDTASVDARSDQYSLGCTLYYMCAGQAPYSGTTVFELISKHMKEPLTPLDTHVKGVPPAFSRILTRMLAKNPDERYPTLKDAARDLEAYLGVDTEGGAYKPRDMHLAILEESQKDYYKTPALKKRKLGKTIFFALMPLLILLTALTKNFMLIGTAVGLTVLIPGAIFVLNGILSKTYLYRRVRSVFFGMSWKNWLKTIVGTVGTLVFLFLMGWLLPWIGVLIAAFGVAVAHQMLIVKELKKQRAPIVDRMQEMLKELRVRGVSEEALQDFVCRFSGADWEEFFEEFFSYEEKLQARAKTGTTDKVHQRKKFAAWRDPVFRALEGIEKKRREERDKKTLAKAEMARLKAEGMSETDARKKAESEATKILDSVKKEVAKTEEKLDKLASKSKRRRHTGLLIGIGFWLFRLGVTALLLGGVAIRLFEVTGAGVSVPGAIDTFYQDHYYMWGYGKYWHAIVAGVAMLILLFSRRIIIPFLVTAMSLILIFGVPVVRLVDQPFLTEVTLGYGGAGLIAVLLGFAVLSKLTGGKL